MHKFFLSCLSATVLAFVVYVCSSVIFARTENLNVGTWIIGLTAGFTAAKSFPAWSDERAFGFLAALHCAFVGHVLAQQSILA